jgi:hypothetical protein
MAQQPATPKDEARNLVYTAGLPVAVTPTIVRLLTRISDLEERCARLERVAGLEALPAAAVPGQSFSHTAKPVGSFLDEGAKIAAAAARSDR